MTSPKLRVVNDIDHSHKIDIFSFFVALESTISYLESNDKNMVSVLKSSREISLRMVFDVIEIYRYDSFGWFNGNVPSNYKNRLVRRYLILAHRLVYPEHKTRRELVVAQIESVLRRVNRGEDIYTLGEEGKKTLLYLKIVNNRLIRRFIDTIDRKAV